MMNKTLSTVIGASALVTGLLAFSPSQAQAAISLYLGNNGLSQQEPSYTYTNIGGSSINLTATGSSGRTSSSTQTARNVTRQLLGLGVYTPGLLGLDNPQIDGVGPNETLLLTFTQFIDLKSITFALVDSGDEFKLTVDGNVLLADQAIPSGLLSTFTFNPVPNGKAFGISVTDALDQYYVKYVEFSPVPEPITLLGTGIALGFGAHLKRKMGKKARNA